MPATKPMKTAVFLMRLTPEEKQRWEEVCRQREISLAEAMREGARLYLDDARERLTEGRIAAT